jgi:MFS superfamily sulfate permease-like transporter
MPTRRLPDRLLPGLALLRGYRRSWLRGDALAGLVGLLCLVAYAARLGFVADLLSKPILVGYLAGVAVTMMVGQAGQLTGVPVSGDSIVAELVSFGRHLSAGHPGTAVFAAAVLGLLLTCCCRRSAYSWSATPTPC